MKLKTKLISIIAPAALITTVAPIALTSCGGDSTNTHITCAQPKQTAKAASSMIANWTLSLKTVLADGEEITLSDSVSYTTMNHIAGDPLPSFTIDSKTSNSIVVKGVFVPSDNIPTGEKWDYGDATFKLNFAVKKSGTEVWNESIQLQFEFSK